MLPILSSAELDAGVGEGQEPKKMGQVQFTSSAFLV